MNKQTLKKFAWILYWIVVAVSILLVFFTSSINLLVSTFAFGNVLYLATALASLYSNSADK